MILRVLALLLILGTVLFPIPVYAIADPDSAPTISDVYIYNNLLETGDVGVLLSYNIVYASTPTETATESYLGVFIDTDATTQLRAIAPFFFDTSGYGQGIVWIYFSAADVTTFSISRANISSHRAWITGNPTLTWTPGPDPPRVSTSINFWQAVGTSTPVLFGQEVLRRAQILGDAWGQDLIESTPVGNRLTATGSTYFTNAIAELRTMAPNIFSSGTVAPTYENIDYDTEFGATITDATGAVSGSPITLSSGNNTVTIVTAGTFTLELEPGTSGTVTSVGAAVTGSPLPIVAGTSTITVVGGTDQLWIGTSAVSNGLFHIGTATPGATHIGFGNDLLVNVTLSNLQTTLTATVATTGFDVTDSAATFGMSTLLFSSLVWLIVSVVVCAAVFTMAGSKPVLMAFNIMIVGGIVLGLVPYIIGALIFIATATLTAYVLFFRGASI